MGDTGKNLDNTIKQRRTAIPLTIRELAARSGVSQSYLARIEKGERFPSATILRKIAEPLDFDESDLLTLAGYLITPSPDRDENRYDNYRSNKLDPYVIRVLSDEPIEIQRAVIGILSVLKSIARGTSNSGSCDYD
jgi:transcriptional regulator with XRE-family HTH domain